MIQLHNPLKKEHLKKILKDGEGFEYQFEREKCLQRIRDLCLKNMHSMFLNAKRQVRSISGIDVIKLSTLVILFCVISFVVYQVLSRNPI